MKNCFLLTIITIVILSCVSSKKEAIPPEIKIIKNKTVLDDWYYLEHKSLKSYVNYTIVENENNFELNFEGKYKSDSIIHFLKGKLNYNKDEFLTVQSFEVNCSGDGRKPKEYLFSGTVNATDTELNWIVDDFWNVTIHNGENSRFQLQNVKKEYITLKPVISNLNLLHFISRQSFSQKGDKVNFNSVEIGCGLNYKKNHSLIYAKDDVLVFGKDSTVTKKIIHKGDGIAPSTYWLDKNSKVIKYTLDGYSMYDIIPRENIDFSEFTIDSN